jgi:hypothetical protein
MAKNNKKSFSDNLSTIFEYTLNEDNNQDNPRFLNKSEEKVTIKEIPLEEVEEVNDKGDKKKVQRKSFSLGLESFFKDSIEEVIGSSTTASAVKNGQVKKGSQRAIGIEILLQRTLFNEFEQESLEPRTKRITFVLDIEKVELLKTIAKKEKKEMRQIISKMIEEYMKEDEPKKTRKPRAVKEPKTTVKKK